MAACIPKSDKDVTLKLDQNWDEKMRNAALILGLIGGLWGMLIGFFSYGYTVFVDWLGPQSEFLDQVDHVGLIRAVSLLAPLAAIACGAMARARPNVAGAGMIGAAAGMYYAFGFGVFTMFPIAFCGLGGVLALAAKEPDAH